MCYGTLVATSSGGGHRPGAHRSSTTSAGAGVAAGHGQGDAWRRRWLLAGDDSWRAGGGKGALGAAGMAAGDAMDDVEACLAGATVLLQVWF